MANYLKLLSVLILLSAFWLVANKRIDSYIKTFRWQSLLLALVAAGLGLARLWSWSGWELVLVAFLTVAVKVLYIPHLLQTTVKKVGYQVEKDFFLNIPIGVLICCGLVLLSFGVVNAIGERAVLRQVDLFLVNSLAVILIGFFFMVSRKKAIGQIIGLLVIENGIFSAAILTTHGMPMIVELGIFFDLLTAVLILGVLVFRINENFDSINLNNLKNLKG